MVIAGANLSGATAVTFGTVAATSFTVISATTVTAVAPVEAAGLVDVTVTTVGGVSTASTADQFTFVTPPTITSLSSTGGPTAGGTSVTITGANLSGVTVVDFGTVAATSFTVISATTVTAVAPVEPAGLVNVTVTTAGGVSAASTGDQFTFVAQPTIISLSSTSGPIAGGTSVTITANLSGASVVDFATVAATSFTVNSATRITAVAPSEPAGLVNITVTTTGGVSAAAAGTQFTYVGPPTVTSLSSTTGPTVGGLAITIYGTNLSGATAVQFGTVAAKSFAVNSATQITAVAPAEVPGVVDIIVTTPGGVSAASRPADQFTYQFMVSPTTTIATDQPLFTWLPVSALSLMTLMWWTLPISRTRRCSSRIFRRVRRARSIRHRLSRRSLRAMHTPGIMAGSPVRARSPGAALRPSASRPWPRQQVGLINNTTLAAGPGFDTPTFIWNSVPDTAHYYLYVLDATTNQQASFNTSTTALTGTSFTPSAAQALTPGHSYTWYIGAESNNGAAAIGWSGPQTFTLAPLAQPALKGPSAPTSAAASTTLSWNPVPGANHYYVYVLDNTSNQAVSNPSVSGASTADVVALTAGHNFTWYLGAVSSNGVAISWTSQTFFLGGASLAEPTQLGPSGTIPASTGFDTPTFSWSSAAGAVHYYLYVLDNTTNKPIVNNSSVPGTSVVSPVLTPGHSYTWYIGAETSSGLNGPIAWSTETFALAALIAPTQFSPSGTVSAVVVSTTPTFSWSVVPGAAHYYLYLLDASTNQVLINNSSVTGGIYTNTPTLTKGHRYTWYIAAESSNGADVVWSGPDGFTLTS